MATTKKKVTKKPKAKTHSPSPKAQVDQAQTTEQLKRERDEALEQLAAASHILRIIASSSTDIQPVLDVVAETAARLCDATDAAIWRTDGDNLQSVAHYGPVPLVQHHRLLNRGWPAGRSVVDKKTVHVHDVTGEFEIEFPDAKSRTLLSGARTVLATPLLREGVPIGAIHIRRTEVRPFSDKQIKLLETFADQAVIAIENVRLFKELQERNHDLTEALEQQTATSEILRVIAGSPTEIQPVLDVVAENAARVCGADDSLIRLVEGNVLRRVAHQGHIPSTQVSELAIDHSSVTGRAVIDRQPIHIHDLMAVAATEFPESQGSARRDGIRTVLAAPLLREGVPIGAINIRRAEVRPFTDKQIKLLETFADQAVIAIENVRLFREIQERNAELREALEHQTATSEVLGIISRSPTDVQPVLDAIVESAARVCGIDDVLLRLLEESNFVSRAHFGPMPIARPEISIDEPQFRWIREHGTLHISDALAQNDFPMLGSLGGWRTLLVVPLRQHGEIIGNLNARRTEVRPFTQAQIKLLETFADQAVIAIENVRLFQELKESLEQQTATSEILGVIASSPTDVQPVLDIVAENAARLCDATDAVIHRIDGDKLLSVANYGSLPTRRGEGRLVPMDRDSVPGRTVIDLRTLHIHDLAALPENDLPATYARSLGVRTMLSTPLMRKGIPIGTIHIRRKEVRPFTEKQIKLLETFASQSVIAIENVRLFKEIQERNAELREALEHQTATAEILGIISRSPTDVQPVLDAIVESAARVCGIDDVVLRLREGNIMVPRAHFGPIPIGRVEISVDELQYRWVCEHGTLHVPDTLAQDDFPMLGSVGGWRTGLCAPLRQHGELIGTLNARRIEVRPFTPAQIKLLEPFADQAVIAIENVRLFQELKESLEQQTATSEILGVIASSPTDIQPVLDVVAENAARVCGAKDAHIFRIDGDFLRMVSSYGRLPVLDGFEEGIPIRRGWVTGRALVDRQTIHVHDLTAESETEFPEGRDYAQRFGHRTTLATPLLREGVPTGAILIRREEVRPFTDKQIKLLETFADQAVIAIENVRLFKELDTRNRQLSEALEQQTATSEILRVIASSPTDIQPVLDTLAENAARLCEATDAVISRVDGETIKQVAQFGAMPAPNRVNRINRNSPVGRAIVDKKTIHVHDLLAEIETEYPESKERQRVTGTRTILLTPLLREGVPIGTINIRRTEVRPFSDKHVKLLETFADQAVIAIENVRLFKELEERTRELVESVEEMKALSEVGQAVSSSLDLTTVLETIVARAVDLSGTDCGVIYEYDEEAEEFNLRASHHMEVEAVEGLRAARIKLGEGATGQAALTRAPVQITDTLGQRDGSVSRLRPLLNRLGYRSLLTVPILRDHQIMGGLTVWRRQVGEFEPEVVNLLQTFATQSALAIHNARLFREIEAKGRELEAANRHKSEFLANVSHELRTPLNAIIGFSEVLGERMFGELNEKQAEYTDDILSSGRHLLSLINDILDLSKIEAGRMELEVTTFHLPDAIENAILLIRERASRHGIKLDRVIDDQLGDFTGDERKIKQILVNLLSNAVKFTPEGGQIRVQATLGDSAVIVSITDTGIGIAKKDHEAIFEEFRQASGNYAQKREGTGLGLTLTRKFVELHGGKIWVDSEPGKGSTFTFTLRISPRPFPISPRPFAFPESEG
jgi:GAF domain-containing protein/anti-sigma regulatory factor (Ser/Thr protein kinase)